MLKKSLLIAVFSIMLAGCNDENGVNEKAMYQLGADIPAETGSRFTVAAVDSKLITVQSNLTDARCPSDAACISAGNYSVDLDIRCDGENVQLHLCNGLCGEGYTEKDTAAFVLKDMSYYVILKDMTPYPTTTNQEEPKTALLEFLSDAELLPLCR